MPVIWITGLPGAGKTSAAEAVVARLRSRGEPCLLLDGDHLREALSPLASGHDEAVRRRLAHSYVNIAGLLARQGITCVVATVSLFADIHARNRSGFAPYLEVLLVCPESERTRRRSDPGPGPRVGTEIVAEWPMADLVLDSGEHTTEDIAAIILTRWHGLAHAG